MTLPGSYLTEYADHRRASRVDVMPRRYRYAERLVPADRAPLLHAPEAVLVAPDTLCWALVSPERTLVIDAGGTREVLPGAGRWISALAPGVVRIGNRLWRAGATEPQELHPFGTFDQGCTETVSRWYDDVWTTVVQRREAFMPSDTLVRVRGNGARKHDPSAPRWTFDWRGEGTAAIADDGTVLLAGTDRSLHVLQHPSDPDAREPIVRAQLELPHEPFAVSAVDDGFVVLSAIETAPAGPEERLGRLHGRGAHAFPALWRTEVRRVDLDLATTWCVELDFAALQPAIDGGDGRVVVVGRGIASIHGGSIAWAHATEHEVLASAFVDGTIAAGIASRLVILDGAGRTAQTVVMPHDHRIVTVPAIGPDGAIAIGTSVHTYIVPAFDHDD